MEREGRESGGWKKQRNKAERSHKYGEKAKERKKWR